MKLANCMAVILGVLVSNGLVNAQSLQPKPFSVNGKVSSPKVGEKVYLQLPLQPVVLLDSATVAADGSFTLKGIEKDGGNIYQLSLGKRQIVNLLVEGGEKFDVNLNGTVQNTTGLHTSAQVKGSTNMEYYQKVMELAIPFREQVDKWNADYQAAEAKGDRKKMEAIQKDFAATEQVFSGKIKEMLPAMGSSFVAVFAANNFLEPDRDIETLVNLATKVEKENPKPKYAEVFVKGIKRIKGVSVGEVAPDFELNGPDGTPVRLSSLRGKYVLIDFWAAWCGPCRQENPNVVKMYSKYKSKNFEIYGVSLDRERNAWLKAIKDDNLTWIHGSDLKYWNSEVGVLYGITGIPATYLLDKNGVVVAKNLRGAALEAKVAELTKNE